MTMKKATRGVVMLVVLSFALRHSVHGQQTTTTTETNCTVNGNTANCTSTSTDNSAAIQAQQERQAEQDKANEQAGAAVGKAMGSVMNGFIVGHKIRSYCKKHAGEPYTWQGPDGSKQDGTCPGTPQTAQQLASSREQEARSWRTQSRCESEGFIWANGECGVRGSNEQTKAATQQEPITAEEQAKREAYWTAHDQALKGCISAKSQAWRAKQPSVLPAGTVPPVDLFAAQCRVEI
jgi:hypothetical protein